MKYQTIIVYNDLVRRVQNIKSVEKDLVLILFCSLIIISDSWVSWSSSPTTCHVVTCLFGICYRIWLFMNDLLYRTRQFKISISFFIHPWVVLLKVNLFYFRCHCRGGCGGWPPLPWRTWSSGPYGPWSRWPQSSCPSTLEPPSSWSETVIRM